MQRRSVSAGAPEPLGVTLQATGVNVAVCSANASAIEFCWFGPTGDVERERIALPERTGDVFHGFIDGIAAGDRYGLRAHGPYDPARGHRFNPAKLLVDPYAVALDRRFEFHASMSGGADARGARDDSDSASFVPKAFVRAAPKRTSTPIVDRPRIPWQRTVIYELHVRGFTRLHPQIPETLRGTCAGLAHPAAIAHLKRLGVTTVELMPIAAAIDEPHLVRAGLTNYWGYNPGALFVPDPRLAPGGIDELAASVRALHASGIEVILDIVLNHTGEGDALGPTVSLRGLDNATYYRTLPTDAARYVDDTGCGNTLALDRPPVLRLAMDVLRYYVEVAGVDGFRFDLATTLGRRDDGFDAAAPLLQAIAQDPLLRDCKLIGEPWDIGPGGHQLGAFPASWPEWNDRYRDGVRRFWRGDGGGIGELATRFAGSADIFSSRARPPSRSLNFVTAHDGFTLADLVSHAVKHNEANGEDNRDGTDANFSWNHGAEGTTGDEIIGAARRRDVRNLLATLLLSRGTPMLAMGDELGRTQLGNNNAYAQDSALTWLAWDRVDEELLAFVAQLIHLRLSYPALHADRWLTGTPIDATGLPDVEWCLPDGRPMSDADWSRSDCKTLIAILYVPPSQNPGDGDRVTVVLNASDQAIDVRWPDARTGFAWRVALNTAESATTAATYARSTQNFGNGETPAEHSLVDARSVVVLVEQRDSDSRRRRSSLDPKMLDRLAAAAGIAADWWDVAGTYHAVSADTKRALLAAMGMPTTSTDDARAHLFAIASQRECRELPELLVGRENARLTVPIAEGDARRRSSGTIRLESDGGRAQLLRFDAATLPGEVLTAVDGRRVARRMLTLPPLPVGEYRLGFDGEASECRIVVAPDRCFLPDELRTGARRFGLAAHLYALRRRGDWGVGDFTTLGDCGAATAQVGGSIVGINPLHMLFGDDRERASPYHPSDRRFLDPIYIDVLSVPDFQASDQARALAASNQKLIETLASIASVDYTRVWEVKRAVLQACFRRFELRPPADPLVAEFDRFVGDGGAALRNFALFEAIAASRPRESWTSWPEGLLGPDAPGIAAFAREHARAIRFALYLQWLADRGLGAAAERARAHGLVLGFFRDLAVGAAPDGGEVWGNPGGYARGVSIGAPPDPFADAGQNWNLPPPVPGQMLAAAGANFRALLRANMRHAGALRVDHVMGLSRLFWIPDGAKTADGAYVDYPLDSLLGLLAMESTAARCLIVGEDLGTVAEGLRQKLAAADVLSYRVLWFEREPGAAAFVPPLRYPTKAATCVSTHDLPTIAGWWNGVDIDEKRALGLLAPDGVAAANAERVASKHALTDAIAARGDLHDELHHESRNALPSRAIDPSAPHDASVTAAVHAFAAASASMLVLLQADDLAAETVALNLPGTNLERPNWRRKVGVLADGLWQTSAGTQSLAQLDAARIAGTKDPAN